VLGVCRERQADGPAVCSSMSASDIAASHPNETGSHCAFDKLTKVTLTRKTINLTMLDSECASLVVSDPAKNERVHLPDQTSISILLSQ